MRTKYYLEKYESIKPLYDNIEHVTMRKYLGLYDKCFEWFLSSEMQPIMTVEEVKSWEDEYPLNEIKEFLLKGSFKICLKEKKYVKYKIYI